MPTYDWACPHGHTFTARAGIETRERPCLRCDAEAARVQVYAVGWKGFAKTPPSERDWSGDFRRFGEASAELEHRHERLKDATQNENLATPPLMRMAKARARELTKRGVTSASDL